MDAQQKAILDTLERLLIAHMEMNPSLKTFKDWPGSAQDVFRERVAIMRESDNIPDSERTPIEILKTALQQAGDEIKAINSL